MIFPIEVYNFQLKKTHIDGYIITCALVLPMARPRTVHFMGDLDGFGIALASRLSSRNRLFTVSNATLSMLEDKIETMKSAGITVSKSPADIGKTLFEKLKG